MISIKHLLKCTVIIVKRNKIFALALELQKDELAKIVLTILDSHHPNQVTN